MSELRELHNAIKQLADMVRDVVHEMKLVKVEQTSNNSQLIEILQMVTGLSVKFDATEQNNQHTVDALNTVLNKKKKPTKAAAEKSADVIATKKPTKKPTKKATKEVDTESNANSDVEYDVDADNDLDADNDNTADVDMDDTDVDVDDELPKKKLVKPEVVKASKKTSIVKGEASSSVKGEASSTDSTPAKKPSRAKAAVKVAVDNPETSDVEADEKKPVKATKAKTTKAAADTQVDKPPRVTKQTLFKKAYTDKPEQFDKYLTDNAKADIANEQADKWADMSMADIAKDKVACYFHYIKDNHPKVLDALKSA